MRLQRTTALIGGAVGIIGTHGSIVEADSNNGGISVNSETPALLEWSCDSSHVDLELVVTYDSYNDHLANQFGEVWPGLLNMIKSNVHSFKVAAGVTGWEKGLSTEFCWKTALNRTEDLTLLSNAAAEEKTSDIRHLLSQKFPRRGPGFCTAQGILHTLLNRKFFSEKHENDNVTRILLVLSAWRPEINNGDTSLSIFSEDLSGCIRHDIPSDRNMKNTFRDSGVELFTALSDKLYYDKWTDHVAAWDQDKNNVHLLTGSEPDFPKLLASIFENRVCKHAPKKTTTTTTTTTTSTTTTTTTTSTTPKPTTVPTTTTASTTKKTTTTASTTKTTTTTASTTITLPPTTLSTTTVTEESTTSTPNAVPPSESGPAPTRIVGGVAGAAASVGLLGAVGYYGSRAITSWRTPRITDNHYDFHPLEEAEMEHSTRAHRDSIIDFGEGEGMY